MSNHCLFSLEAAKTNFSWICMPEPILLAGCVPKFQGFWEARRAGSESMFHRFWSSHQSWLWEHGLNLHSLSTKGGGLERQNLQESAQMLCWSLTQSFLPAIAAQCLNLKQVWCCFHSTQLCFTSGGRNLVKGNTKSVRRTHYWQRAYLLSAR